jgi:hypothetical protein
MKSKLSLVVTALSALAAPATFAHGIDCPVSHSALKRALVDATKAGNGGLALNMWATIVNREGFVCAVAFSGADFQSQWIGSRVISAQKANTANDFNLGPNSNGPGQGGPGVAGLALSTANLYGPTQPGGSLYGLQHSNPVDTGNAYEGDAADYGTSSDPMVGKRVGGVNVFGGGLGLYNGQHAVVGGVGVSGDSSCADHAISWRVRHNLGLDHLKGVNGVNPDAARPDNIIYGSGGFTQPHCFDGPTEDAVAAGLPAVQ